MHHAYIDRFAQLDSPIHRLDARAKFVAVIAYSIVLISFGRYAVAPMIPMVVGPLALLWLGRVPLWFAMRRVIVLSPFILMMALTAPLYDRQIHMVGGMAISGGWLMAGSIAVKFTLGVLVLTALICTTPFSLLLEGMRRLGMPRLLTMQLGFLYRYIFVLIDEAMRIRRARDFRGAALAPMGRRLAAAGGVVGSLFVRTLGRSERISLAMSARGYTGQTHGLTQLHFRWTDVVFLAVTAVYLILGRWLMWM